MGRYLAELTRQGYVAEGDYSPFHRHMLPWLLRSRGVGPQARILDIGAGQGHTSVPLRQAGWRSITVLDNDDQNFARFREEFGFATLKCDIARDPIPLGDATIAAVVCFHLIEHLRDPSNLMEEVFRILETRGLFFLVTPDWQKQYRFFWGDPTHVKPYDKTGIARLFRMYDFDVNVRSWNPRFGFGRLQAYRVWPRLGMIGLDLLAVGRKPER